MTVSTTDAGVIRLGNGVTTAFPFDFETRLAAEIKVATVTGIITIDINPNDYVVTIEPNGVGGTVTFLVAPADGTTLYIYRDTPLTQLVSVASQQRYDPEVAEGVWDKITFLLQELAAEIATAVKTAPGESPDTLIASLLAAEEAARLAADEADDAATAAAASAAAALAKENSMLAARGTWLTATLYKPSDIVRQGTAQYRCLVQHTSGVFATDLAALRWEVWLQDGAAGAGTGDMLNSDNLSGLTNKPLALSTLGGQAASSKLTELAAPTYVRGDLIVRNSTVLTRLAKGTATQVLGGDGTDTGWVPRAKTTRATLPGSGSSQTFGSLPPGLEDIDLFSDYISMTAGASILVRLGTAGGIVASGYANVFAALAHALTPGVGTRSDAASIGGNNSAGGFNIAKANIQRVYAGGNVWMINYIGYRTEDGVLQTGFTRVDIGGELTQIQVLSSVGTFDNGNFSIKW